MNEDERLLEFLKHCQQVVQRLREKGAWLWDDFTDSTDDEVVA